MLRARWKLTQAARIVRDGGPDGHRFCAAGVLFGLHRLGGDYSGQWDFALGSGGSELNVAALLLDLEGDLLNLLIVQGAGKPAQVLGQTAFGHGLDGMVARVIRGADLPARNYKQSGDP